MRIGTRSSAMALAQTGEVARRLSTARPGIAAEIVRFTPTGDRDQVSKLDTHGGKGGAFVGEIRAAMLAGTLDAAMHSLKDMPGNEETPGLVIAAHLPREAVADALVLRAGLDPHTVLGSGGAGLKFGTNAVRRAAYLRRLLPQAEIIHFRGAADTRVRKLDEGILQRLPDGQEVGPADALVMAASGLGRVGLADRIAHLFSPEEMLPAIGQGIVAVECPEAAFETRAALAAIDDEDARLRATAEREVLWVLDGHCNSPVAGLSEIGRSGMRLKAAVIAPDGGTLIEAEAEGPAAHPRSLGRKVGLALLEKGAGAIIEATRPAG